MDRAVERNPGSKRSALRLPNHDIQGILATG